MFGTLLKKQMTEIFRGYFYDAKKNKKRSTTSTVMFILLYLVVMVGILGGMFYIYLSYINCPISECINIRIFSRNNFNSTS